MNVKLSQVLTLSRACLCVLALFMVSACSTVEKRESVSTQSVTALGSKDLESTELVPTDLERTESNSDVELSRSEQESINRSNKAATVFGAVVVAAVAVFAATEYVKEKVVPTVFAVAVGLVVINHTVDSIKRSSDRGLKVK